MEQRVTAGASMQRTTIRAALASVALATSLLAIPAAAGAQNDPLPTPESVFGFTVGADGKLFDYAQSMEYFRRLAGTNPHVRLIDVGRTSFGREWSAVIISSPENL